MIFLNLKIIKMSINRQIWHRQYDVFKAQNRQNDEKSLNLAAMTTAEL